MYIHWKKSLEVGSDLIDTQHRMEMLLCRKLDIAIKSKEPQQTMRWVLLELKEFTKFHFLSEENLMHEINYPEVDKHALIHADLLMQLDMALAKISHHKEFPEDLLYFLNKWLGQHIVQDDLKVAEFIKNSVRRPIGEDLYDEYLLNSKGIEGR